MQLVIVLVGAVLGFIYGYKTDGFIFSSNICLFAGLTMIMPSLFKVKLGDVKLLWQYRIVIVKSLGLNFVLLPVVALIIGLITHDYGIAAGIFLLSVLSGGGMVMYWIKKSGGDTSLGFLILFLNLLLVSLSFLMLHLFGVYTESYFGTLYAEDMNNMSGYAKLVIELLIVIPFIASRIIILSKPVEKFIEKYRPYISNASMFVILFYLFGLQSTQNLVDIFDFEPELIVISFLAVIVFYVIDLLSARYIFDLDSPQERAAFWHSATRYITLALVLSTFSMKAFGVSMLLPIMFAYVIQIPFAIFVDRKLVEPEITHRD
jgi:predicted Na+-dependent transporter